MRGKSETFHPALRARPKLRAIHGASQNRIWSDYPNSNYTASNLHLIIAHPGFVVTERLSGLASNS